MDGATSFAVNALVNILISLVSIGLTWWLLQNLRLDVFLREPDGPQAKALYVVLTIVLGHGFAIFIIDYLGWSRSLTQLFS